MTIPEIRALIESKELNPKDWNWNVDEQGDIVVEREGEQFTRIDLKSEDLAEKVLKYLGV